jgi:hypothetical protein
MRLRIVVIGVVVPAFIWLVACQRDEACLSNQNAVQAGFYSAWSTTDKDSTLSDVSVYGLGVTDSVYSDESLNDLFLPLSFSGDTTGFVIGVKTLRDTLWLVHQKELDFISGNCGYVFSFELDTILHTGAFIDSVVIDYSSVRYGESAENIKLYIY